MPEAEHYTAFIVRTSGCWIDLLGS